MKSPGLIYRMSRQVKRKMLYLKISESYKKSHSNCAYGHCIKYTDNESQKRSAKMCTYAYWVDSRNKKDYRNIDVCTNASACNAFASKHSRDQIIEEFEREIADPQVCSKLYPELYAYIWVLDKDLEDATKSPQLISRILLSLISFFENLLKKFDKTNRK